MSADVMKDLLEALLIVARMAEGLKKPCGMDPESPRAIRNAQYMNISYAARAAITRAEAALAEPQPDADGWIPWAGGECPLADGVWHRVKFRNGDECLDDQASSWGWGEAAGGFQIIAYRVVKP